MRRFGCFIRFGTDTGNGQKWKKSEDSCGHLKEGDYSLKESGVD